VAGVVEEARFGYAPAIVTDNIITRKNNVNGDITKGWVLFIPGFNAMTLIEVTAIAHSKGLSGLFPIFDIFLFRLLLLYKLRSNAIWIRKIDQINNRYFFSIPMYCLMGIHFFYFEALIINFYFSKTIYARIENMNILIF
jgi:hypothetical protein